MWQCSHKAEDFIFQTETGLLSHTLLYFTLLLFTLLSFVGFLQQKPGFLQQKPGFLQQKREIFKQNNLSGNDNITIFQSGSEPELP